MRGSKGRGDVWSAEILCRQGSVSSAWFSLQRFLGAGEGEYSGIFSGKILQRDAQGDCEILE